RVGLGLVERGEVVPVGLDVRSVGDVESDRAEDRLDALPGSDNRVDAPRAPSAAGKRYVEGFFGEAGVELGGFQRLATGREGRLDAVFRSVDARAGLAALL